MRKVLIIGSVAAALGSAALLSSCADKPLDLGKADAALSSDQAQTAYALTCGTFSALDDGYKVFVAANPDKISAKAQDYVSLAETAVLGADGTASICTAPYPTSVASLAQKVGGAVVNMFLAYQAQGLKPSVTITAPPVETTAAVTATQ